MDTKTIARESFRIIETGDEELARRIIAPDFVNEEADDDPEDVERQLRGRQGFSPPAAGCATRSPICVSNFGKPSRSATR
jgi:hypothetical protein